MTVRQLVSPVGVILAAAGIAVTAAGFALIPPDTMLPVHWGLDGTADLLMPRTAALLMPVGIAALVWAVFLVIDLWAPPARKDGGRHAARTTIAAITGLLVVIQGGVVAIGTGVAVDMAHLVAASMGVLLVILGNVMPKTRPNSFAGLRLPTTLNDAANWQATHRLTGWLFVASGAALFIASFLVPAGGWLIACLVAAIAVPLAIGINYSLRRSLRGAP